MRILGAPIVQSCCTLWISASYSLFHYGRYRKSKLLCVWVLDLDLSRHHPLVGGAAPVIPSAWPLCPKIVNRELLDTICTAVCDRCDSSTTCRLCHCTGLLLLSTHSHGPC